MFVVAFGDAFNGVTLHGPFEEHLDAADDIDRMVADMLARGDIARDKQTGEYLALYCCFRFERD